MLKQKVKDDVIRFRVTKSEKKALTTAAQRVGLELSTWLRVMGLQAAGVVVRAPHVRPPGLHRRKTVKR